MVYLRVAIFLSLALNCNSLIINVVAQLRDGIRVGTPNSGWAFENIGSAISIAIEDSQAKGLLTEHTFRVIHRDSFCNPGIDMKTMADLRFNDRPDMWIGMSCSKSNIPLGRYLSNWRIAFFPLAATHPTLSDKSVYTTLLRLHAAGDKNAKAFTSIFRQYGWRRAAMVTAYGYCSLQAIPTNRDLLAMGVTITEWIQAEEEGTPEYLLENYVDRAKERARVIILCLNNHKDQLTFLRMAHAKGMRAPDYVFLTYGHNPTPEVNEPWKFLDNPSTEEVKEWKKILFEINYKQVFIAGLSGPRFEAFYERVPVRLSQPPWNYNTSLERGWRGSPKAVDMHDGTVSYLVALNETLSEGGDWTNGDLIQKKLRNRVVYGLRGKFRFDENANRIPDYWIFDLQPGWDQYKEVILISLAESPGEQLIAIDKGFVYWGTDDNRPPPDTPACGFQNELCPEDNTAVNIIIGLSVSGALLLTIGVLCIFLYRRHKEEQALQQTVWRVNFSDIVAIRRRTGSVTNMSQRSMQSVTTEGSDQLGIRQFFTEVGTYKGNMVAILHVNKPRVTLDKTDFKELKAMKDMSHDNLALFVGACVDPPNMCYIIQYYTKGSLMDILVNDVIGLDWMFKTSLLSDLVKGMAYLHKSELGSHGHLKSSCCLVDSRMQVKVSSFGLHAFKSDQSQKNLGEYEKDRKLLWTSPELLRMPGNQWPRYGTQKGDVYSFGVIAQEVIYRAAPYFMDMESPKAFLSKLSRGGPEAFRPPLPKVDNDTPPEAVRLIEVCWKENPTERPTFEQLGKILREINQNEEVDIMSSMIDKLEKYANNLEDIVNQRTGELLVEKQKTDSLLFSMLPQSIAEQLKNGETVHAELYEAVTIYFSDIVGFTALSLESTPLEVVNLLNDLYSLFDDIIELHDVYKVETISDSYMVVSGLPRRNGDKHVGEIANLALDLMSAAINFRIRHRPGLSLQLRVGFHTGPCAAGVVGLSMPRYCLFGDTVNMASRMETNGKALRIHMSKYAIAALESLGGYHIEPRGEMQIKGKGLQMTYWLLGRDGFNKPLPPHTED